MSVAPKLTNKDGLTGVDLRKHTDTHKTQSTGVPSNYSGDVSRMKEEHKDGEGER